MSNPLTAPDDLTAADTASLKRGILWGLVLVAPSWGLLLALFFLARLGLGLLVGLAW